MKKVSFFSKVCTIAINSVINYSILAKQDNLHVFIHKAPVIVTSAILVLKSKGEMKIFLFYVYLQM